jgi:HNH endonuclease
MRTKQCRLITRKICVAIDPISLDFVARGVEWPADDSLVYRAPDLDAFSALDGFSTALIDYWGGRCPITGITDPALLRASHIVPWAECDDAQRLDVHNGLLLSALWDAAFDTGLVSFANDGSVLARPELSAAARTTFGIEKVPRLPSLRDAHRANLAIHRARHGFSSTSVSARSNERPPQFKTR